MSDLCKCCKGTKHVYRINRVQEPVKVKGKFVKQDLTETYAVCTDKEECPRCHGTGEDPGTPPR